MGIHLGSIYGGPEMEGSATEATARALVRVRQAWHDKLIPDDDGELDVVYQYHGSILQPAFTGIRTGTFSRRLKMLQIQIAVPREIMQSDEFGIFYVDSLEAAVRVGKAYFDKRKIPFSLHDHLALVQKLRDSLA